MCYACAGSRLQFCVLEWGDNIPRLLGRELLLTSQRDRLCIIAVAVQMYQVIKARYGQLPDHYLPLGWTQTTSFSSIDYFDGYVQVSCRRATYCMVETMDAALYVLHAVAFGIFSSLLLLIPACVLTEACQILRSLAKESQATHGQSIQSV